VDRGGETAGNQKTTDRAGCENDFRQIGARPICLICGFRVKTRANREGRKNRNFSGAKFFDTTWRRAGGPRVCILEKIIWLKWNAAVLLDESIS
jgi:hypothetical protein